MKIAVSRPVSRSYHPSRTVVLLLLLFSLALGACAAPAATEAATVVPNPTSSGPVIDTNNPCEVNVGENLPLVVSGISEAGFTYQWTATSGRVEPTEGPAVNYVPSEPGAVTIRVEAIKDGTSLTATINCTVKGPTPTPETPTAAPSPTLAPTQWACTSYRSEKIQGADIPGQVTINTPPQGSSAIQSRKDVEVAGSHTGLPADTYLWVFLYSKDAGLHGRYYPQTRDAVKGWQPDATTGADGLWSVKTNFGAPDLCYEIVVMAADAETSQSIRDQLQKWAANDYAGYELHEDDSDEAPGLPAGLVEKASIEIMTK
jgi:hypothetical protein